MNKTSTLFGSNGICTTTAESGVSVEPSSAETPPSDFNLRTHAPDSQVKPLPSVVHADESLQVTWQMLVFAALPPQMPPTPQVALLLNALHIVEEPQGNVHTPQRH